MLFIYLKNEFSLSYSKYACTKQTYCWLTTGLIWHLSPPTPKLRFSPRWPIWQIPKCQTSTMFIGIMFCCVNKNNMTNSRRIWFQYRVGRSLNTSQTQILANNLIAESDLKIVYYPTTIQRCYQIPRVRSILLQMDYEIDIKSS